MMIVECLLIKDENQYLCEHIRNNMLAGVDFFFIYDNMSDVPVVDFLTSTDAALLNYCSIERYNSCGRVLQLDCYNDFISKHAASDDYVAFVDTDELFEGDLKAAISLYCNNKRSSIRFESVLHGCAGRVLDDGSNTLAARFRNDILRMRDWTKTISRISTIKQIAVHNAYLKFPYTQITLNYTNCNIAHLHHYRFRSFEEYVKKILRGGCDSRTSLNIKSFFDYNTSISTTQEDVIKVMSRYNVDLLTTRRNGNDK